MLLSQSFSQPPQTVPLTLPSLENVAAPTFSLRLPPQMMGIVPENDGGFGDVEKAARVFARNELVPLQARIREINAWLGDEVIAFDPYVLDAAELDPAPSIPAR